MVRRFNFVGKIDENTPVLGTTYGEVKEVLKVGFEEQFRQQEMATSIADAPRFATQLANVGAVQISANGMPLDLTGMPSIHDPILVELERTVLGMDAYGVVQGAGYLSGPMRGYFAGGSRGVDWGMDDPFSTPAANEKPEAVEYRRRVGDKDFSR